MRDGKRLETTMTPGQRSKMVRLSCPALAGLSQGPPEERTSLRTNETDLVVAPLVYRRFSAAIAASSCWRNCINAARSTVTVPL